MEKTSILRLNFTFYVNKSTMESLKLNIVNLSHYWKNVFTKALKVERFRN